MFECGYKSQYIGGQKEKFVRLEINSVFFFKKKCPGFFLLLHLPFLFSVFLRLDGEDLSI